METLREYTVRDIKGRIMAVVTDPGITVEEICSVCHQRGTINGVHDESVLHLGSPTFKAWTVTPEYLREFADALERQERTT